MSSADSSRVSSFGSLLKYVLAAFLMPTALCRKSNWFRYIITISSLVKYLSSFMAITHSIGFCISRSMVECALPEYTCFASCCVMVLPPPALDCPSSPLFTMARAKAMKSTPEWSKKRASSVATSASITLVLTLLMSVRTRFSLFMFHVPITFPSALYICVAYRSIGFCRSSISGI